MASSKVLISRLRPHVANLHLSAGTITGLLPKFAKLLVCLLFLVNIRSWPLMWHFRVFKPVFALRFQYYWGVSIRSLFRSPSVKLKLEDDWWNSISPIGEDPFRLVVRYNSWASPDECDFNLHLSNSSYAKTLDSSRFQAALRMFPRLFYAGGWIALAATNYHFIREIPILASFEVRSSIVAWDQKWVYIMSKFVCKSDGKAKRPAKKPDLLGTSEASSTSIMALRTAGADAISLTTTPLQNGTPGTSTSPLPDTANTLKAVAADLISEEPDGATLHTIAISQICFKIGRITVPPGLIMAASGLTGVSGHSHTNPPPELSHATNTMLRSFGGSRKKLKDLLVGGWRDVPESERWWDRSLGERVEAQRVKNISKIEGLRKGLERAREL